MGFSLSNVLDAPFPPLTFIACRGRIKFYTHPPEEWSLPSHVSSDIVKEWGKAFDIQSLIEEEKSQLSGELGVYRILFAIISC